MHDLGSMVGRQTPFLALFVPIALVWMIDGRRGVRQTWPAAVVCGVTFAIGQFVCSNYISIPLTDIVAALLAAGAVVVLLRVWSPSEPLLAERARRPGRPGRPIAAGGAADDAAFVHRVRTGGPTPRAEIWRAYAPT